MARYQVNNQMGGTQQAMSSTYKSLVTAFSTSGALRRGKVYDILIGTNGTPADNFVEFDVARMTADGTGTALTPNPLDPADVAMLGTSKANYTAEPTGPANATSLFYIGINQRASYRWVAAPGSELVYPSTANNGFALRAKSAAYTGSSAGTMYVDEQ